MHTVQDIETRAELEQLMAVKNMIISPQKSAPVLGLVQDALLGAYVMTRGFFLTPERMMDVSMHIKHQDKPFPKPTILVNCNGVRRTLYTGQQVFDLILPPIHYHSKADDDDGDEDVLIRNGRLMTGVLSKKTLGATRGSIIHRICLDIDNATALHFISDAQRVINRSIEDYGFSVGIGDCIFNGTLPPPPENASAASHSIERELQMHFATVGSTILEGLDPENSFVRLVKSGAKGSNINIAQICGLVGQQSVMGNRIRPVHGRTLPEFDINPTNIRALGFCENSYLKGLSPSEYFYHAQGGREGLIDTAVKTASTGYIQRRLVKTMEDATIVTDSTVRNSSGEIMQLRYGGDGWDSERLERVKVRSTSFPTLRRRLGKVYFDRHVRHLIPVLQDRDFVLMYVPIDIRLLVKYHSNGGDAVDTTLAIEFADRIATVFGKEPSQMFRLHILIHLPLVNVPTVDKRSFWDALEKKCWRARITFGSMVGAIAAVSLGEPCTQLTLNSFHTSGVLKNNVTAGVPRLKFVPLCFFLFAAATTLSNYMHA